MTVILIIVMVVTLASGVYIILTANKPKKEQSATQQKLFGKIYSFLSTFFLTQSRTNKIYNKLSVLSIYNKYEIATLTAKYYLTSTGVATGLIVAAFFLFKDALSFLICVTFSLLVSNVMVDKQIDKINARVYLGLHNAISSIRQEYMRLWSVPEALGAAKYDDIIRRPMEEIHNILVSSDGELKLHEFYETTPFRPIQTLASICYNINDSGDEKDEHGNSNFIQALTLMSNDVNSELQRLATQKAKFGFIEYLPFIPVLTMTLLESYFISIMPGTALIYEGPIGYLSRTLTLLGCILSYSIISRVNSNVAFKQDDRDPWVLKLLEIKFIDRIMTNITPKALNDETREKKLKSVLSKMSLKQFYTKKTVYAMGGFLLAVIIALSTITLGREFIQTSTQQLSLVATNEMDKYSKDSIQKMDKTYLESNREWREDEIKSLVKSYMPGLSDLQILDQIKRLRDKKSNLDNAYFHWWYIWICVLTGLIGWFGPNMMMTLRKYIVNTEAENDFLQLQTLVSILMNTNIDTLDTLHQLCQSSRVHKDMLLYCYHSFPANPEKELVNLQRKTPILEFKNFIGKLQLTISDLSLKEAFSDLIIEREHILKMNEIAMMATLNKRRALCGPLSLVPLGLMVIGELVLPLGILGVNEFMNAMSSLG